MDLQLPDSSTFEHAFFVAQQRHRDTAKELIRLREDLRERDAVIKRIRVSRGDRFDAELENRLLKDQLRKLQEGLRQAFGEGMCRHHDNGTLVKNFVVKLPLENLTDILSFLDRFSLDRVEFTCPQLRAAVSELHGVILRDLSSVRLRVHTCDEWKRSPTGSDGGTGWDCALTGLRRGGGGRVSRSPSAGFQRCLAAHAKNAFTIVVDCFSETTAVETGVTSAIGKMERSFVDLPKATSHFAGLLRNASVQELVLVNPLSHHFVQALSTGDLGAAVGSLTIDHFEPEAATLAIAREGLMSFDLLENLAIDHATIDLLSDRFLLAATKKRVTSIELKSSRFSVYSAYDWGWSRVGWDVKDTDGSEFNYPELGEGLIAFVFRKNLQGNEHVKLRFPVARVPQDICLSIMQNAVSSEARYSIDVRFAAVGGFNDHLVGFEAYRVLKDADDVCVIYRLTSPDFITELKIITAEWLGDRSAPPPVCKLIEFRRYRKRNAFAEY